MDQSAPPCPAGERAERGVGRRDPGVGRSGRRAPPPRLPAPQPLLGRAGGPQTRTLPRKRVGVGGAPRPPPPPSPAQVAGGGGAR